MPDDVLYDPAPSNPGLAEAYNRATAQAVAEGYTWLLTLDQDTTLPSDFLVILAETLHWHGQDKRIGAVVGHCSDEGRHVSPVRFAGGFWPRILPSTFAGLAPLFTIAFNSASLLRVEAIQSIGGYDRRFPLNNSDTSLFYRLGASGRYVYVVRELAIKHQLAIMNRAERMSPERYVGLLADERAFWDLYMTAAGRAERLYKLCGRLVKDLLTGTNTATCGITWREIHYRVFTPRRRRLKALEQ